MVRPSRSRLWLLTVVIAAFLVLTLNIALVDTTYADSPSGSEPTRVFQIGYDSEYWGFDEAMGHKRTSELTEDTGSVLVFVHGIFTDSEVKAPEAQSLGTELGLQAFVSFEYRDSRWRSMWRLDQMDRREAFELVDLAVHMWDPLASGSPPTPTAAHQARGLLLSVAEVYFRTQARPVIVAHSRGALILVNAAALWEGLAAAADIDDPAEYAEVWATMPRFTHVWEQLDEADQIVLLSKKKAIRDAAIIAVTGCPAVPRTNAGWLSLLKWTHGLAVNLYSATDGLVGLVNGERGYIPALTNIRFRFPHGGFFSNPLVRQTVAAFVKRASESEESSWEPSEELSHRLVEHNFGEVPEEEFLEFERKLYRRPESPPPWWRDSGSGGGGGGAGVIMPIAIDGSLGLDQEDYQFLTRVVVEARSTGTTADLVVSNGNPFSITFSPVIGSSYSPHSADLQGLMVAPGGPVILAIDGEEPDDGQGYLFTAPPLGAVVVTLNTVCINRFKPIPVQGYSDFTIEGRGQSPLLSPEQNEKVLTILDAVTFIEYRAVSDRFQTNDPFYSTWLSIASHEEVLPDAIQFAVWTVTNDLTYHYLKYQYLAGSLLSQSAGQTSGVQTDVNLQAIADQVNLLLAQTGLVEADCWFAPPWDVNWDSAVDQADYDLVKACLGESIPAGYPYPNPDVNRDGKVDASDLELIESYLGEAYVLQVLPPFDALSIRWGALESSPLNHIWYLHGWGDTIWVKTMLATSAVIVSVIAAVTIVRRRIRRP